jgi:pSer/pThr/pTyr-binding forkhead associated (FHA) protein
MVKRERNRGKKIIFVFMSGDAVNPPAESENTLNYILPPWAGPPKEPFTFEIIKNGIATNTQAFTKDLVTVGRLPICDIQLDHQSISRLHAVVQCKNEDNSKYIYDLGSTHGTYLNKLLVPKEEHVRIRVGDMLRFGASSRLFVLQGELEPERILSTPTPANEEITWGFGQDAFVGDEWVGKDLVLGLVDRSTIDPNEYYLKDPKKALELWFSNRGEDLEIKVQEDDDKNSVSYISRIELPIETGSGQLVAIGTGTSKKKSERDACIEACAKLDKLEILRSSDSQRKKYQKRMRELYADDEVDDFYDRTKQGYLNFLKLETKKVEITNNNIETYSSLNEKKLMISTSISNLEQQIKLEGF